MPRAEPFASSPQFAGEVVCSSLNAPSSPVRRSSPDPAGEVVWGTHEPGPPGYTLVRVTNEEHRKAP